jgi:hypothetical protein
MPGFRISNVKTESGLADKYPDRCVSGYLGGVLHSGKP